MLRWLLNHILGLPDRRSPDIIIGGDDDPYMLRWWVIPRNRFFNVYLHFFLRSDDDRALHDHPWASISIPLVGEYLEHSIAAGGVANARLVSARRNDWRFRPSGKFAHRIELVSGPCWTLFITGPRYREWGFHCVHRWIHWKEFTATDDPGAIGKGCAE